MNPHSMPDQPKWFIRTNLGETRGPFTAFQIADLLSNRMIAVSTLISKSAAGPFKILTEYPEFALPTSPPPLLVENQTKSHPISLNSLRLIVSASTVALVLSFLLITYSFSNSRSRTTSPTQSEQETSLRPPNHDLQSKNSPDQHINDKTDSAQFSEPTHPSSPSLTFEEVISRTEKSVCRIQSTTGGGGSGFLIDTDKVMTNRHVVDGMLVDEIEVSFPNNTSLANRKLSAIVLYEDPKLDVAILKIPTISTPPLTFSDDVAGRVRRGMDIVSIGSPGVQIVTGQTIENAVSRGLLSSETIIDGVEYYQASIAINPGNSGGPILDLNGTVVGMVTLKDISVEGMAFAVPVYSLRDIYDTLRVQNIAPTEIALERLNQEHDARVIINRTTELLVYDLIRLGELVGNISEGITDFNLEVDTAFAAARELDWRKDHRGYATLESITGSSIKRISTSKHLSENTRLKIGELWGLSREVHGYVVSPRGSVNTLKNKLIEIEDKALRLRSELNTLFDFGH